MVRDYIQGVGVGGTALAIAIVLTADVRVVAALGEHAQLRKLIVVHHQVLVPTCYAQLPRLTPLLSHSANLRSIHVKERQVVFGDLIVDKKFGSNKNLPISIVGDGVDERLRSVLIGKNIQLLPNELIIFGAGYFSQQFHCLIIVNTYLAEVETVRRTGQHNEIRSHFDCGGAVVCVVKLLVVVVIVVFRYCSYDQFFRVFLQI